MSEIRKKPQEMKGELNKEFKMISNIIYVSKLH